MSKSTNHCENAGSAEAHIKNYIINKIKRKRVATLLVIYTYLRRRFRAFVNVARLTNEIIWFRNPKQTDFFYAFFFFLDKLVSILSDEYPARLFKWHVLRIGNEARLVFIGRLQRLPLHKSHRRGKSKSIANLLTFKGKLQLDCIQFSKSSMAGPRSNLNHDVWHLQGMREFAYLSDFRPNAVRHFFTWCGLPVHKAEIAKNLGYLRSFHILMELTFLCWHIRGRNQKRIPMSE